MRRNIILRGYNPLIDAVTDKDIKRFTVTEALEFAKASSDTIVALYEEIRILDNGAIDKYIESDGAKSVKGRFGMIIIDGKEPKEEMEIDGTYDLSTVEGVGKYIGRLRHEIIKRHMIKGVIFRGVDGIVIGNDVEIEAGAIIEENVTIIGKSIIRSGAVIGRGSEISDSIIGEGVVVKSSRIDSSSVGDVTTVGPYANIHTGSSIGKECRIGNFVEIKNSNLGDGTKAAHLAYIGDADIGRKCNIGCGAIFVNYDGEKKSRSKVGDGVFIGSNSNVIAPVELKDGAYLAAGSTLTVDLPGRAMCIARSREVIKEGRSKYNKL